MASNDNHQRICDLCRGLNAESLSQKTGYQHAPNFDDLEKRARSCPMCQLIEKSIKRAGKDKGGDSEGKALVDVPFICQFSFPNGRQDAVLEITQSGKHHGFVRVYSSEDDPAYKDFKVEPKLTPDLKAASPLTFPLGGGWIKECLEHHKCGDPFRRPAKVTSNPQAPEGIFPQPMEEDRHSSSGSAVPKIILDTLPARLIRLNAFEADSLDARLVNVPTNCKAPGDQAYYASLSYCWGPMSQNMYKTTLSNLSSRQERISHSELPKTFQDAFHIARRLKIPYLWIDAICIIQDSDTDWEAEAANMGGIYATGLVTIAADVSSSVDGGILNFPLTPSKDALHHIQITSLLPTSGGQSTLSFYEVYSALPGSSWTPPAILNSPLSERAWCLQERMLSSRIIHFTSEGLVWECRQRYVSLHMISSCDEIAFGRTLAGVPRILEEGQSKEAWGFRVPKSEEHSDHVSDEQLALIHKALGAKVIQHWDTRPSKSPPIRGEQTEYVSSWYKNVALPYSERQMTFLADRLPAISGLARLFAEYIQSPYIAGLWLAGLEEGLEWGREGNTFQDHKLDNFPSFAWASQPGPVSWPTLHMRPYGRSFTVVDHHVELSSQLDPYGKIVSAHLTLSGYIRLTTLTANPERTSGLTRRKLLGEDNIEIGDVDLDFEQNGEETPVYCFLLYKDSFGFLRILVLSDSGGRVDGIREYRRVGIGSISQRHKSWLESMEKTIIRLI